MSTRPLSKPYEIFLVEDNPGDTRLLQEAFGEGKTLKNLTVVKDGVEALSYLRQQKEYSQAVLPDIILLDLNLPRKDGRELLVEIKQDVKLKRIPIIIFTISTAHEDILETYNQYANCYITKPVDLDEFMEVAKRIESFWLTTVRLPPERNDVL